MTLFRTIIFGLLCFVFIDINAQVNAYAKVTSISGTTISLSNVNESFDSFETDEKIIIMQMQDDVIGSNTSNNSSFGDLNNIESVGLYEVLEINTITENSGTPISITVKTSLNNSYNIGTNSSVQIISYPELGMGGDYTTTSQINAVSWNGNIGGVICFYVNGDLTINHDINADYDGFNGGSINGGGAANCNSSLYISSISDYYANKGEGIYKNTYTSFAAARGKILNAGGGGNSHNGGGGGGGNYSAGGDGGAGWQCDPSAGGLGGISLSSYISSSRIFLGGGGGAGEGNNDAATPGGNGGGIIIISADTIKTSGICSGILITADGESISPTTGFGGDGAGGGGAGGSIILNVNGFDISNDCSLTTSASGGNGGDVTHDNDHGAGGGGGMGTIIYSIPTPADVTTDNNSGDGGANGTSTTSTTTSAGAGTSDDGVIDNSDQSSLPIELLNFNLKSIENGVIIYWTTTSEKDNHYFQVLRSYDLENWQIVAQINGNGTTNMTNSYEVIDPLIRNNSIIYYRLKQVDFDGMYVLYDIASISNINNETKINLYPNPTNNNVYISNFNEITKIEVFSIDGRLLKTQTTNHQIIDLSNFDAGLYYLRVYGSNGFLDKIKVYKL